MERIPVRFADQMLEDESDQMAELDQQAGTAGVNREIKAENLKEEGFKNDLEDAVEEIDAQAGNDPVEKGASETPGAEAAGPVFAELIATRAELKRVQSEANELRDGAARRQADFDNFRKRIERITSKRSTPILSASLAHSSMKAIFVAR